MTHPTPSPGPHTGMIPVIAVPPRPRGAAAFPVILSMVGAAVLMTVVGVIWFGVTGGPAGQAGAWDGPIPFPEQLGESTSHAVTLTEDTAYFRSVAADQKVFVTAVDRATGARRWSLDSGLDIGEDGSTAVLQPGRDAVLVTSSTAAGDDDGYLIEADTGRVHRLSNSDGAPLYHRMIGGVPVRTAVGGGLEVLDAKGDNVWEIKDSDAPSLNITAVATAADLYREPNPADPVDAAELVSVGYDGTVTVFKTGTGEVVSETADAVSQGSTVLVAFDDVLYTKTTEDGRDTITGYDMADDFAEIDDWEGDEGAVYALASPCGPKRVCFTGYRADATDEPVDLVIDPGEGIVWNAADELDASFAYLGFAGDTMAAAYHGYTADGQSETQLYDADFEKLGAPVPGLYLAVDAETYAAVSQPRDYSRAAKPYDAQVSVMDGADGGVSILDSYPVYPGCGIDAKDLACATEAGYRLWSYR